MKIFRSPTTRPNIRYEVRRQRNSKEDIQAIIQEQLAWYPDGQIIVYGTTIKRVETLAQQLGCPAYFRNVRDKREVFEAFQGPHCPVIVATNALGLGIDNPNIRVVVHADGPRHLRDFGQESGRAGRDGRVSQSIVIIPPGYRHPHPRMQRYLEPDICRRVALDEYLDGREDRVRCEAGEEACDRCGNHDRVECVQEPPAESPIAMGIESDDSEEVAIRQTFEQQIQERERLREYVQRMRCDEAFMVEDFRRRLVQWSERCPICYIYGVHGTRGTAVNHSIMECSIDEAAMIQEEFRNIQTQIRYGKYGVCYECGVPQAICSQWRANGYGGWQHINGTACQYPDTIIGAVAAILIGNPDGIQNIVMQWIADDGVDITQRNQVYQWMGQKIQWGGIEAAKIDKLFFKLVEAVRD